MCFFKQDIANNTAETSNGPGNGYFVSAVESSRTQTHALSNSKTNIKTNLFESKRK